MPEENDPPRKVYQLKPRVFDAINELPKGPEQVAPLPLPVPPSPEGKIEIRDIYRQAATSGPLLSTQVKPVVPNEVHTILRDNLAHANAAGLNDLAPKPRRKSRRKRDYWLLMTVAGGFFGVC